MKKYKIPTRTKLVARAFRTRLISMSFGDLMRKKSTDRQEIPPAPKPEPIKPKKKFKFQIKWYARKLGGKNYG